MGQGGAPGRGGEFRRRGEGPGLLAAANSSETLAGAVNSDDESRQPGGDFARGRRGKSERRGGAICRHGSRTKRQGLKELKRGGRGYCAVETVSGVVNARKTKLRPDVQARADSEGEGRKEGTGSG
jgi:hypothetical protein